jgi:NAD(P)H dehydrogenase (quinone)
VIAVTGATGRLGHLVVEGLLGHVPPSEIVAAVRSPGKASSLATRGVQVRLADYTRPETLRAAFLGVKRVLLISAADLAPRFPLHQAVIDAATEAEVDLLAYTSLLRADTSRLFLAPEHQQTERYIRASGLPFAILRNGWYLENHTAALGQAIAHGALVGSSRDGRFASASRADYAAAAVATLTRPARESLTYELAGDHSFSLSELASEVSRQIGRDIPYRNLSREEYAASLLALGLPRAIVDVTVDADAQAIRGDLDSASRDLSRLIGRPTTALSDAVASALGATASIPATA